MSALWRSRLDDVVTAGVKGGDASARSDAAERQDCGGPIPGMPSDDLAVVKLAATRIWMRFCGSVTQGSDFDI
jgi:hypothetical protein